MYKFHITGYAYGGQSVDVTVFSDTLDEALKKAEALVGGYILSARRKIVVEECRDRSKHG